LFQFGCAPKRKLLSNLVLSGNGNPTATSPEKRAEMDRDTHLHNPRRNFTSTRKQA
jgi:hypothetical protein